MALVLVRSIGINKLRFMEPVPVGSRIRSRNKLIKVLDIKGGWQVNWRMSVEIEGAKRPACIGETVARYYRLDSDGDPSD